MSTSFKEKRLSSSDASSAMVSVIIPVLDDEIGVLACLEGLDRQVLTLAHFEVVIVDNGSNPPLKFPSKILGPVRVIRSSTAGSYSARNAGARAAKGNIFAFTDADCVPMANWLEMGVRALLNHDGEAVVGGEVMIADPPVRKGVAIYQSTVGFEQHENIGAKRFSATANLFCTASQFKEIGSFDERLLSGGDREWSWRAADRGYKIVFEPKACVSTTPRTSLRSAVRQARRVAAGRQKIRKYGIDYLGSAPLRPHRSSLASLWWIVSHPQLTLWERMKVLNAAVIIKAAATFESLRLRLGGRAERR